MDHRLRGRRHSHRFGGIRPERNSQNLARPGSVRRRRHRRWDGHPQENRATRRRFAGLTAAALIAAGCATGPDPASTACAKAAEAQTAAEIRLGELTEEHDAILDNPGTGAHDDSAALIAGARVDLIIDEAETRHNCV